MTPKAPIGIYHIEGRRSFRVVWTCEELGLPYDLIFTPGDLSASMARMRTDFPLMPMSPVAVIDGHFMVETGAILDALVDRYGDGRLAPSPASPDFLLHRQWMHYSEASVGARGNNDRFMAMALGIDVDQVQEGYRAGDPLEKFQMIGPLGCCDFADAHLAKHDYFSGAEFSVSDIMMQFVMRGLKLLVGVDTWSFPNIARWRRLVEARPAYARTVAACTPTGADEHGLPRDMALPFPAVPEDRLRKGPARAIPA